jgi:hypothetical protein
MAEVRRVARQSVELLTSYGLYLRASDLCRRGPDENNEALRVLRQAIGNEPDFAPSYALAACCLHLRRRMGWAFPKDPFLQDAIRLAQPRSGDRRSRSSGAVDVRSCDCTTSTAIFGTGSTWSHGRLRSIELTPVLGSRVVSLMHTLGEAEAAIDDFQHAQSVSGRHITASTMVRRGNSLLHCWPSRGSRSCRRQALAERSAYPGTLRLKIATSGLLGHIESAHAAAHLLRTVNSDPHDRLPTKMLGTLTAYRTSSRCDA